MSERLSRVKEMALKLFEGEEWLETRKAVEKEEEFDNYELQVLEAVAEHPLFRNLYTKREREAALLFGLNVATYVKSEIIAGDATSSRFDIREQQKLALEAAGKIGVEFAQKILDLAFETTEKTFSVGE